MTERNNIEIDYCPSCRGVWLDKGELDKMLDYASQTSAPENMGQQPGLTSGHHNPYGNRPNGYNKPHKKKSFLGDLFDFD